MDILIGADFVPTHSNIELFETGNIETLFGTGILELSSNAKYQVFNLEMPLCDKLAPINKCGPNLAASTKSINAYKALNVSAVTLANNHIIDQGVNGLHETILQLVNSGIKYFGAGDCLIEAKKPLIITLNDKTIGMYACAEHEFSVAGEMSAGVCPFDPLYSLDHIAELKSICDFVIVLYHGGKEHYRYPSPMLQKSCRRMIEKGADLVLCQHSHCIGCEEEFKKGKILYGQGNFLFDDSDDECWQTGLLVGIDVSESLECHYYPIRKFGNKVRLAEEEDKKGILKDLKTRSEEIKSPEFIIRKYNEFSDAFLEEYLIAFAGKRSKINRILNRISGYKYSRFMVRKRYDRKSMTVIRNFVECEAHREVVLNAITRATEGGE